jgi:hypothetical protein
LIPSESVKGDAALLYAPHRETAKLAAECDDAAGDDIAA